MKVQCYVCQKQGHVAAACKETHLVLSKLKIQQRFLKNHLKDRHLLFRYVKRRFHPLRNKNEIESSAALFCEQYISSESPEDSGSSEFRNELTYNLDDEIQEEEVENSSTDKNRSKKQDHSNSTVVMVENMNSTSSPTKEEETKMKGPKTPLYIDTGSSVLRQSRQKASKNYIDDQVCSITNLKSNEDQNNQKRGPSITAFDRVERSMNEDRIKSNDSEFLSVCGSQNCFQSSGEVTGFKKRHHSQRMLKISRKKGSQTAKNLLKSKDLDLRYNEEESNGFSGMARRRGGEKEASRRFKRCQTLKTKDMKEPPGIKKETFVEIDMTEDAQEHHSFNELYWRRKGKFSDSKVIKKRGIERVCICTNYFPSYNVTELANEMKKTLNSVTEEKQDEKLESGIMTLRSEHEIPESPDSQSKGSPTIPPSLNASSMRKSSFFKGNESELGRSSLMNDTSEKNKKLSHINFIRKVGKVSLFMRNRKNSTLSGKQGDESSGFRVSRKFMSNMDPDKSLSSSGASENVGSINKMKDSILHEETQNGQH